MLLFFNFHRYVGVAMSCFWFVLFVVVVVFQENCRNLVTPFLLLLLLFLIEFSGMNG